MPEKILVTGGAGFIGSHVVDAFIAAGNTVVVADNLRTGRPENIHPEARFYKLDIGDQAALSDLFRNEKPTVVAHLAAMADVRGSVADPVRYAMVNVIGTLNLLEISRAYGVRKFLFASTGGAIYGDLVELPATEASTARPLDPYGASKLACEQFLFTYGHNYGLNYCILRFPNVYGPRQDPYGEAGVVAIFIGKMLRGEYAVINGDGLQQRDFVYVTDIARAHVMAQQRGRGIYNLGSEQPTDINTLFHRLARLTGYRQPEMHASAKPGEVRRIWLNTERARNELAWEPQVSLDEGLQRTVAHFAPASFVLAARQDA